MEKYFGDSSCEQAGLEELIALGAGGTALAVGVRVGDGAASDVLRIGVIRRRDFRGRYPGDVATSRVSLDTLN